MANRLRRKRRHSSSVTPREFLWDAAGVRYAHSTKSQSNYTIILALMLSISAIFAIVFAVVRKGKMQPLADHSEMHLVSAIAMPPESREEKSQAAINVLLGFVNDHSHQERVYRIYEQANVLERLVEYYDNRENILPRRVMNPSVSAVNLRDRELLLISFTDQAGRQWSAPFEWKGDSYLMHWEAMVGFGEISWEKFFQERPEGHFVMRANFFLPESDTFSPLSSDRLVILMRHPELTQGVSVEVQVGSEAHQKLRKFPKNKDIPGVVDLCFPEGEIGMPLLSGWLQRDWITR